MNEFKKRVFEMNRELPRRGLVTYTWGNVSGTSRKSMEKTLTTDKG